MLQLGDKKMHPRSIENYVTRVHLCSQQRCSFKYAGYYALNALNALIKPFVELS